MLDSSVIGSHFSVVNSDLLVLFLPLLGVLILIWGFNQVLSFLGYKLQSNRKPKYSFVKINKSSKNNSFKRSKQVSHFNSLSSKGTIKLPSKSKTKFNFSSRDKGFYNIK